MALTKLNEERIATITFKYKTAQRKFEDGTIWDRLRQESPVYNGDTIRTADLSEATLHFIDGNEMSLSDNTMTQVFLNEDKQLKALLSGGSISLDSTNAEGSAGVSLVYNDVEVNLEAGTSLNITGGSDEYAGELSVQVFEGNATLTGESGVQRQIKTGDAYSVDKKGEVKKFISIKSPLPNAKVLNHKKEAVPVMFNWGVSGIDDKYNIVIDIAQDAGFKKTEATYYMGSSDTLEANLTSGLKYYRIQAKTEDGEVICENTGKVQVVESLIPRLIAPVEEYQYHYRKQLPAVRFLWSESKYATSYELVVADNPDFRNPKIQQRSALPSSIVSTLEKGKWYWKVTPFYTINNIGLDGESDSGIFEILQQGNLSVPVLQFPSDNAFVNTKNASKNMNYSWKLDRETVSYNFAISSSENMENPVFVKNIDTNFYPLNAKEAGLKNGTWYWSVQGVDQEGNKSQFAKARSFYAVDGEIIQRTVYPVDHYSIAQNLLTDLRFTWKTNLPFETRFEIAKDSDFKKIAYRQNVYDTTLSGVNIPVGNYYWRIVSSSSERDFASPVKELNVLGPLDAPVCIVPDVTKRALVRPNTPFDFKWSAVDGANYYKLTIKDPRTDDVIFEQNLIEDTMLSIDLEDLAEGQYEWNIQSFSYETDLQSRRTGKIGEARFDLKKIHPVDLLKPLDNITYNGVDAILNPQSVSWNSRDELSSSEFVLVRTDVKPNEVIRTQKNPDKTIRLPRLHSGTYSWTVNASSVDGFDLSPAKPRVFTVTPVPPLESATKLVPENRYKFDAEYFKSNRTLNFSWAKVKDATHYIVRIEKKDGTKIYEKRITGTSFEFTDMNVLDRGTFTWSVEAIRCIQDGTILQESKPSRNNFIIDLPELKSTKLKSGVMYGK